MKSKRFNPRATRPQVSPFGDTYNPAGRCAKCGRSLFTVTDGDRQNEPDPRGFAGPQHSLTTFEEFPSVPFCWDCVNEHGHDGYTAAREIAERMAHNA